MVPNCGKDHDARDIIRLYKDTMREDAIEFGDLLESIRAPTQQELKIAERVARVVLETAISALVLKSVKRNVVKGRCIIAMFAGILQVYSRLQLQIMTIHL